MVKKTLLNLVGNRLFTSATVVGVESIGPHFRLIEIEAAPFKAVKFTPGAKVQINVGDWNVRTYTPLSLDNGTGRMKILAFVHGNGPGSAWADRLAIGAGCQLIGPASSIRLAPSTEPLAIVGDETAFAMAATFKESRGVSPSTKGFFEVSSVSESQAALRKIGLAESGVFPKDGTPTVNAELLKSLAAFLTEKGSCSVILAGRASTILAVRSVLREQNVATVQLKVKAYWADGKTGID